jgi:XTP/dITP diphosphohydrolase
MKVVLASGNQHKLEALSAALPDSMDLVFQGDLGIESAEETGLTFVENAILKARHASEQSGLPSIADDSGLEVDFLKGSPGIYSSRYAGINASDQDNNLKLLATLQGVPKADRTARFRCVIVFMRHETDPMPVITSGTWEGLILEAEQGANGFGYDPIFYIPAQGKSAAELSDVEKNQLGHRGQALSQLRRIENFD